jgi:hypoxanthine-DNA glycosylase
MAASAEPISGFPPVAGADARTLILGSMPSEESLRQQQYYAHPRNGFWRIMMTLFGMDPELSYSERTAVLKAHGIALWDVLKTCQRPGSLDTSIINGSEVVNDFKQFFEGHPDIQVIFFNGRKAEQIFHSLVLPALSARFSDFPRVCLPSTSPAMASLDFEQKLERWRPVIA